LRDRPGLLFNVPCAEVMFDMRGADKTGSVALTAAVSSCTLNAHVSDAQSVLIETKQYWLKSTCQPTDSPPSHSLTLTCRVAFV